MSTDEPGKARDDYLLHVAAEHKRFRAALEEIAELVADEVDVEDDGHGSNKPNLAMRILTQCDQALGRHQ